jgi:hypothetical protein
MVKSSNGSDFLMLNIDGSSYAGNNLLILTLNDVRIPGAQGSVYRLKLDGSGKYGVVSTIAVNLKEPIEYTNSCQNNTKSK